MNDYLSNSVKKEVDKIQIPDDKLEQRIGYAIKSGKKDKRRIGKKVFYISSAAVLLLGLLVGSAFVSPVMANVVSRIPYLGSIFQSEPITSLILDDLKVKGYKIRSVGIRYEPKKMIIVYVEAPDDYNEVKNDVGKITKGILKSKGYDAYSVKVSKSIDKDDYVLNEEETKEKTHLENKVNEKLKEADFKFDWVQVDPTENTIFINVVGSKEYYNTIQDAVKKTAIKVASENNYKDYRINVTRVTVKVTKPDKGSQVITAITEGLMSKKEYKVSSVGYKSKPLTFIIRTSILSTEPTAKTLGTEIESTIVEFLESKEISPILDKEPYKIIVNSKDNKKMN
jgi:Protein of unknown function (DUF4030)